MPLLPEAYVGQRIEWDLDRQKAAPAKSLSPGRGHSPFSFRSAFRNARRDASVEANSTGSGSFQKLLDDK